MPSFGLPGKGEMDPTMVMSIFFNVFLFGLMLSDAAYGLMRDDRLRSHAGKNSPDGQGA